MNREEFLSGLRIENRIFVNGRYTENHTGQVINKISSYDGEVLPEIFSCDEKDINLAVDAAYAAYESGIWRDREPSEKKTILLRLADIMDKHKEELAILDTIETSRAYNNYLYDSIPKAVEAIRYFSEALDKQYDHAIIPRANTFSTITREPLGVVGIITPWNDPMVVAAWKFAPALLMGNSVVMKPAEQSSYSLLRVAQFAKEAGIPDGVFNVVTGYGNIAGKHLALHPKVSGIFFTGSTKTGKEIIQYSGRSNMKRVGLECGGKSPFIISEKYDDLNYAAQVLASNMFYNQGQICSAPSRVIVDRKIKRDFLELLKRESEKYIPANPYNINNKVGCLVSREQYEKVIDYINVAYAETDEVFQALGTNIMPEKSCCIQPTIISGISQNSRVAQEEIFGPVVVVLEADGIQEAIEIANNTKYGLAGAVFTNDYEEAYFVSKEIRSGLVHINSYGEDDNIAPFGGFKESGWGKDKSSYAFDEYSQLKTVWMKFKGEWK